MPCVIITVLTGIVPTAAGGCLDPVPVSGSRCDIVIKIDIFGVPAGDGSPGPHKGTGSIDLVMGSTTYRIPDNFNSPFITIGSVNTGGGREFQFYHGQLDGKGKALGIG